MLWSYPFPFHLAEDSQKHLAKSGKSNKFGQPAIDLMLRKIHSWSFSTLISIQSLIWSVCEWSSDGWKQQVPRSLYVLFCLWYVHSAWLLTHLWLVHLVPFKVSTLAWISVFLISTSKLSSNSEPDSSFKMLFFKFFHHLNTRTFKTKVLQLLPLC